MLGEDQLLVCVGWTRVGEGSVLGSRRAIFIMSRSRRSRLFLSFFLSSFLEAGRLSNALRVCLFYF